jgi:FkbM family methyltransferase
MTFVSYAQNFEDVMLWRALRHVENGFYIDVGASDPEEDSVTKAFYDRGWHGINIEPVTEYHQRLSAERPRDVNLALAAGESEGELRLFDIPAVRGWASPDPVVAQAHRANGFEVSELRVPVRTLASICEEHVKGELHFLKIDVECYETEVIRGMDFKKWRPWILVVEATLPNSQISNHDAWEFMLAEHRYRFAYFDGLNRYYLAEEHGELAHLLATPPNVFDDFQTIAQARALQSAQSAEARTQQAEARTQELERQMTAMKRSLSWRLTVPLRWVREARGRRAEAKAEAAEDRANAAEARAEEAERRAHEAENKAQHLQAQANAIDSQLQDVLASTSWKISAPLRWSGRFVIVGKDLARQAIASPRGFARRCVLALLRRAVQVIRRSPALSELAWRIYGRFPVLGERMMRHARSSGSAGITAAPGIAADSARDLLSLSDAPLAWTELLSPSKDFKGMLSRELQHRQTNESQ